MTSRKALTFGFAKTHNRGLAPQRLMNNPGYALIFPGPAIFARLICFFHELRFFKELRRD